MYDHLKRDTEAEQELLARVLEDAKEHLESRSQRPAAPRHAAARPAPLPQEGLGAQGVLELFRNTYRDDLTASNGPRYFGFVIGGVTPAALMGDWLASLYDQNSFGLPGTVDRDIEDQAVSFIREMLNLDENWFGALCSGATMANFVGLAAARQWAGGQQGEAVSERGLMGLGQVNLASGCAHASTYKAVAMLGMGRSSLTAVGCLPGREAVDVSKLEGYLISKRGEPVIVIANLGTANTGDYDDLEAIVQLKEKYGFYLHVDAAIMGIACCSPIFSPVYRGIDRADSVTVDAHKWLNTTYDSALYLTRHKNLVYHSFAQSETAPGTASAQLPLFHFTPEGSRRFRALPLWFSLMAYGREGYRQLVESNCELTRRLAERMRRIGYFRLLNEVRLNIICYTLDTPDLTSDLVDRYVERLRDKGITFSNTTNLSGVPAIRICLSNYLTGEQDVDLALDSMIKTAEEILKGK